MLNNFKQLNLFYKIIFILSIISPIILFICRICTGFFTNTNNLFLIDFEYWDTVAYKMFLIVIKIYQILHPFIMCAFNFISLKLNRYKFLTIIISAILFIIGIDNFFYLMKLIIVFSYIDIRERYF